MRLKNTLVSAVKFLILVLVLTSCHSNKKHQAEKEVRQPYNVLFIAMDDLRTELNCYDMTHIKSPNIGK